MTRTDERKNCINFCFHADYLFGFLKLKRVNFCSFSGAVEIPDSTKILRLYVLNNSRVIKSRDILTVIGAFWGQRLSQKKRRFISVK